MKESEQQYIVTQDTQSILESLNERTGLQNASDLLRQIDIYLEEIGTQIQSAVEDEASVTVYKENYIDKQLSGLVSLEMENQDAVCICLDRFLIPSLEQSNQNRFARFSITRRNDGIKVPRQKGLSFEQQIEDIKIRFGNIYDKKIILVDDGIFSGGTIKEFLTIWESFEQRPLPIYKIITFIGNGTKLPDLPVQVATQSIGNLYEWIDIRDFGPWGGKQLSSSKNNTVTSSVPYLYPWSNGEAASLSLTPNLFDVSKKGIEQTINLVTAYEQWSKRSLTFRTLVKSGFPLPTDIKKTLPVSINDNVIDYLKRALERIVCEQNREVIIFDMDGTLYQLDGRNNEFSGSKLEKQILENALQFVSENITKGDMRLAEQIVSQGLNNQIGISKYLEETYAVPREQYFNIVWNINPTGIVKNYIPAQQAINQLTAERPNVKKILLTSAPRVWAEKVLDFLGLKDQFEIVYSGDQFGKKSEIFAILAKRYQPTNITSVGDQETTDIQPAMALGCKAIRIITPEDIWKI